MLTYGKHRQPIRSALLFITTVLVLYHTTRHRAATIYGASFQTQGAASDPYFEKWLTEDAAYIITDDERRSFKQLTTSGARYQFIDQFWFRRDPTPDTVENEFKEEHYRRIAYANEHFGWKKPGWKTDRGRIYIYWGPPDWIESKLEKHPSEIWHYHNPNVENPGTEVRIEFEDLESTGEFRMVMGPSESETNAWTERKLKATRESGSRRSLIRFKDMEAALKAKLSLNQLPFDYHIHFVKTTNYTVLATFTFQVSRSNLTFQRVRDQQQAVIHVHGKISGMDGRLVQIFEGEVISDMPASLEKQAPNSFLTFEKFIPMEPGSYRLDVAVKDHNEPSYSTLYTSLEVPPVSLP